MSTEKTRFLLNGCYLISYEKGDIVQRVVNLHDTRIEVNGLTDIVLREADGQTILLKASNSAERSWWVDMLQQHREMEPPTESLLSEDPDSSDEEVASPTKTSNSARMDALNARRLVFSLTVSCACCVGPHNPF